MATPVTGRIHSFESCGMVDGPGLRFVAFLQGCPLRCLYCHNPDSWRFGAGREISSEELVREAWKYRQWHVSSGGGMTLSGGEPLAQPDFVRDVIARAHKKNIHVAIDTSGFGSPDAVRPCLDAADLVILDVKTADAALHKSLTGVPAAAPMATMNYLKETGKPMWVRHVLVPGLTDNSDHLDALKNMLAGFTNLQRFELLPFHKMGEEKWEQEGLNYTLSDTPAPDAAEVDRIRRLFQDAGIPVGR